MRGTVLSLSLVIVCCLAASCRKAKPVDGPGHIKSISIEGDPCIISYIYDDIGRISSVTQCDTVEGYTYTTDSIVYTRSISGAVGYTYIYHLDESGRATDYRVLVTGGLETDYTITYDADGHRMLLTDVTHPGTHTSYIVSAGNEVYDTTAPTGPTITRTFYTSTSNTLSNENYGRDFLGASSVSLKKTEAISNSSSSYTIHYFYTLDYLNGVDTRISKVNDSVIETRAYEYYDEDD